MREGGKGKGASSLIQKRDQMAQTLGAEDGRLSMKMKAELSVGKDSVSTWLPLVLRPQEPYRFPFPSLHLLPFFLSPLESHVSLCILHKFSSILFSHNRTHEMTFPNISGGQE